MTRTLEYIQLDGARYLSEAGIIDDFWPEAASIMPSYKFRYSGNSFPIHHFLRFEIVLPSQYVTIKECYLTLYWSPNINFSLTDYRRSAHFGGEGFIEIGLINKTTEIINATIAKAQQLLAHQTNWDDEKLKLKNRVYSVPITTQSLHTAFNDLISAEGSSFTELYVFLCPLDYTEMEDVGWVFKSKESIKYLSEDTDNSVAIPVLTITYSYDPILPDADFTLDQTISSFCQFDLRNEFSFTLDQTLLQLHSIISLPQYEFTLIQDNLIIQSFTELVDQTVEQSITLSQDFTILKDYVLDQTLTITQEFEDYMFTLDQTLESTQEFTVNYFQLIQVIDIEQEFTIIATLDGAELDQTLVMTQEFTLNSNLSFILDQTLHEDGTGMDQFLNAVFYTASGQVISNDQAEVCDVTLIYNSTPSITLIPIPTVTLQFPHDGPPFDNTVILTSPEFGNIEEVNRQRIQRRTPGGKLITYADAIWIDTETFKMVFENLEDSTRDDILTFIDASLGKKILLTDHESRVWTGIITNPNGELLKTGALCGNTFEFEFRVL